jgi:predicted metal-dependent hydrolase
LSGVEREGKPAVTFDHRRITLKVRPGTALAKRKEVMHAWYRALLHAVVPQLIGKWEEKLGVKVSGYYLQRMKTKWGGCNHKAANIRLNTELVKKPKDLLEYVVVHEMLHLREPTHNERFMAQLAQHFPTWRESRAELNEFPLSAETWGGVIISAGSLSVASGHRKVAADSLTIVDAKK